MDETKLLQQFESGELHSFHHRDHIHIAWLYLRRDGWENGYQHIQHGIQHFAAAQGHSAMYHETITRFWAHLIQHLINERPEINDFETLIATFPILLDKGAIKRHFSSDVLQNKAARHIWKEPDLIPMPSL